MTFSRRSDGDLSGEDGDAAENYQAGAAGKNGEHVHVYLPPRSVYVLTGEARWEWAHGIAARTRDRVDGRVVLRDTRVRVTFRWMKEGADVLT